MLQLIGRTEEIHLLQAMLESHQAEFLALYGRRRIGKTYLIMRFFEKKKVTFFRATGQKNGSLKDQIHGFTIAIGQTFYHDAEIKEKQTWFETFESLHQAMLIAVQKNEKIVLFFDEFPWMVGKKSKLLETLEYYWNHYWVHDPRIKLIICGSSAAWIIRKIVNQKGGLHNRITRKIQLKPFKLKEMKAFLSSKGVKLNHKQITEIYMVTGGIPYYLTSVIKGQSAAQIIESIAFRQDGILLNEFDNLFSSLFEHAEPYVELLRIVSQNKYGIEQNDLIDKSRLNSDGGTGVKRLNELVETGFLMKFMPHFNKKKGIYYRLIDEYTHFYLHWIEPLKNTLLYESLEPGYWEHIRLTPAWSAWAGYAFESVCYQHLPEIRKKLGLNPTAIPDAWRYVPRKDDKEQGAQIDLLFDRKDGAINLCEIKYTDQAYILNKSEADNLLNKKRIFENKTGTNKQIFLTLISAQGMKPTMYSEEIIDQLVTLDDLFEY